MARRKEKKKAEFQSFNNCFHFEQQTAGMWNQHFGNDAPITFELGCGHGTFSYQLAQKYPDRNFVGVDLKAARMWRAAGWAERDEITNLAFLCQNLRLISNSIAQDEADEIWITFPDPFPKKRQAKHRMINSAFLQEYRKILRPGGKIRFKTDNLELFQFALETFVREGNISLLQLSFDLHQDEDVKVEDARLLTEYEKQFLEMGKAINYVEFTFQ